MGKGRGSAVLVSVDPDTAEIMELVGSAGYDVVETFVQRRDRPDPEFYIGDGKADEVSRFIRGSGGAVGVAIFNGPLKPGQVFHLEKKLGVRVFDRTRLILEIFAQRASSQEARLQVELARLRYEVPLVREYIHRTRTGEHPGLFFSGGEYQVDDYYRMIRARMAKIRRELERVGKERAQRRKTRRRGGHALVALAGYTNAGKSTLFKALTREDASVGPELFTTLSTTTRRLQISGSPKEGPSVGVRVQGSQVLLTDTVGFIRALPPWLIEAFMSTLEEVFLSDAVVVVVDLSDDEGEALAKTETTLGILRKGGVAAPVILALNKADLLEPGEAELRASRLLTRTPAPGHCIVSALDGRGLEELVGMVLSSMEDFFYGRITGPADIVARLAREEGLAPEPSAGPSATIEGVLLRGWRVQRLRARYPSIAFNRLIQSEDRGGEQAGGVRDR
ncbi:MAG: GTPase HflX [Thermoplasmatota archaeon]